MSKKAIVLLSGGLDSTTVAAIVKSQGYEICALSFRYGQRHQGELAAAESVAREFGIDKHVIADIDLRLFGGSALTADIDVPKACHPIGFKDMAGIFVVGLSPGLSPCWGASDLCQPGPSDHSAGRKTCA